MKKKDSHYREAVERLRETHSDKLESIFQKMYDITQSDTVDKKDAVNAAKVCVSLLGVPKPATSAKEPDIKTELKRDKPTLSKEHSAALDDILGHI